jgi:membrane protein DedA with SNARE-associated domain
MTPQHLELLVQQYGYLAVLVGTFLEGESILIAGGFLAHRGYMALPLVMLAAFAGSLVGDQLAFFLGRWRGPRFLEAHPAWKARAGRIMDRLHRHRVLIILFFRFAWGLRNATPFVLGASGIPVKVFLPLNAAGAAVWAAAVGAGGYFFGYALEAALGRMKHYEHYIVAGLILAGAALWLWHARRARRRIREEKDAMRRAEAAKGGEGMKKEEQ